MSVERPPLTCGSPLTVAHRFSLAGMYIIRVLGLNAAGGQFLPPHTDGQYPIVAPVLGLCSGSTSGRPVFGSMLLNTFCRTNGRASTNLMGPSVRSRNHRYPLRAASTSPFTVRFWCLKSIRSGGETSSQSHESFG